MRKQTEPPAGLPLSVEELAAHLRFNPADDRDELERVIRDATAHVENETGLQLCAARWINCRDRSPLGPWAVRPWPLLEVESVTYIDSTGTRQTWSSSLYVTDAISEPGLIVPAFGQPWPAARLISQSLQASVVAGCAIPITDVEPSTDVLTLGVYVPDDDTPCWITGDAQPPQGLAFRRRYFVKSGDASARTIKLAATAGGSAIDITSDGTGTLWLHVASDKTWNAARRAILLLAAHWWEHRETQVDGQPLRDIAFGVQRVIDALSPGDDFVRTENPT